MRENAIDEQKVSRISYMIINHSIIYLVIIFINYSIINYSNIYSLTTYIYIYTKKSCVVSEHFAGNAWDQWKKHMSVKK